MAKVFLEGNMEIINLIAKGTRINGELLSGSDIRIDGDFIGNIESKGRLVIGLSGKVEGHVTNKNCEIHGSYKGKLSIGELLQLKNSCKVTAEIYTKKISVEPGAYYTGKCWVGEDSGNSQ